MDDFAHDSIDLTQPAIRLARLFGGHYADPVCCEIFEASLDLSGIIPYQALSYVWGDGFDKKEICINEKRAFVTRNLFKALKSIRQIDEDTILWVDALCIDQSNHKEKGHQVSQMRLVYERAEDVIIWLGESDADTDILFDDALKLDKDVEKLRKHRMTHDVWKTIWEEQEKERARFHESSKIRRAVLRRALWRLRLRSWFKRVWVIQEAASAQRATIRCGLNAVPSRTFAMMPQVMGVTIDSRVRAVLDVMPGPSRSTCSWWNASRDLETLLKKFGRSESSNPRDTIYALLGISSNFKDNRVLSPDYDITFEEAVQNTIWALLFGEVLDRSLWKLPTWDKTQFLNSLQDLPGNVFDWALSERETPMLVRLLTSGSVPDGGQVSSSIKGSLYRKVWLHTLIQNDGPLSAIQAFMPHADLVINRMSDVYDGNGPLHLAAEMGLESVACVLLQHPKVDVNLEGDGSIVRRMLQASKYYSSLDWGVLDHEVCWPDTPLNIAVSKGNSSVVKILLQYCNNGIRVQVKNAGGTALHLAAAVLNGRPEDAEVVNLLLQHEDVDINGPDWQGMSPLNIAAIHDNDYVTRLLLQHEGIDVHYVGGGSTPLESAVDAGSISIVSILIKDDRIDHGDVIRLIKRAVRSSTDPYRHLGPPLGNQLAVVKELLAGCSEEDGEVLSQALIRASESGYLSLMQLLLDKGARTNARKGPWYRYEPDDYQQNMTPLYAAVIKGNESAVRLLLNHGAQPDDLDKNLWGEINKISEKMKTPLALAARRGRQPIVEMLLIYGASVHHKDFHGTTPLLALLHEDASVQWRMRRCLVQRKMCPWDTHAIELLSLHGANISSRACRSDWNKSTFYSRTTALIIPRNASKWIFGEFSTLEDLEQLQQAAALPEARAHASIEDLIKMTTGDWLKICIDLDPGTTQEHVDIARSLLEHGANIEAKDSRGVTILWVAVCRHHIQLVDLLLSFGADTEASDSIYGRTPLWVAALLDFDDMIHKLLGKGAKREFRCKLGKTPLCIAAEKGCRKSVKALVNSQADLHAKDFQGRTPLDLARVNGHEYIEGYLKATIDAAD